MRPPSRTAARDPGVVGVLPTVDERHLELARVVVQKVAHGTAAATAVILQLNGGGSDRCRFVRTR
jgi:hypothetical protein